MEDVQERLRREKVGNPKAVSAFFTALAAAQADLSDPARNVRGQARGNRNYRYADLGAVTWVLRQHLPEHGLCFLQPIEQGEGTPVLRTIVAHSDGHSMSWDYPLAPWPKGAQEQGSLITYARRYQLMSVFGLAQVDDDGLAHQQSTERKQAARQPKQAQPDPRGTPREAQRDQQRRTPKGAAGRIQRPKPPAYHPSASLWIGEAKPFQPDQIAWVALLKNRKHPEQMDDAGRHSLFSQCVQNQDRVEQLLKGARDDFRRTVRGKIGDLRPILKKKDGARSEDIEASKAANERAYRAFIAGTYGVESLSQVAPWRIYGNGVGSRAWFRNAPGDMEGQLNRCLAMSPEQLTALAERVIEEDKAKGWIA